MSLEKNEAEAPIAVVFVADGLRASALGAYGNTIYPTDALDQLAAESVLFEWAHTDTPRLSDALESVAFDSHSVSSRRLPHLGQAVGERGGRSILVTDDPTVADGPFGRGFDRCVLVDAEPSQCLANSSGETHLASFFMELLTITLALEPGTLLWVDCRYLYQPWDAPIEYRKRNASAEDPEPLDFIDPPTAEIDDREQSEDWLFGIQQAYGAQVILFDELFGLYREQSAHVLDSAWFGFTSFRGFPLGEHLRVGESDTLFAENVHVPLLIKLPSGELAGSRSQSLVHPSIVHRMIVDWFSNQPCQHSSEPGAAPSSIRTLQQHNCVLANRESDSLLIASPSGRAFRTMAWSLICHGDEGCLFVKPDDCCEVNDVFDRCPSVAEKMKFSLDQAVQEIAEGQPLVATPLPDEITRPLA